MAPTRFHAEVRSFDEHDRTEKASAFDNSPFTPSYETSAAFALETDRPLPTEYLLALAGYSTKQSDGQPELHAPGIAFDKPCWDCPPRSVGSQYGIADSVMAPLTVQDGPMIVVLLSIVISIVLVVEVCEFWQRRSSRLCLEESKCDKIHDKVPMGNEKRYHAANSARLETITEF